jgi:hypothetical protein
VRFRLIQDENIKEETRRSVEQKQFTAWRRHSANLRAKHNVPKDATSWTGRGGVALRGVPHLPRIIDLIDTCFAVTRATSASTDVKTLTTGLWLDLSQDVSRRPWSRQGRTFTSSSLLYSFEHDAVLPGSAHLRLLGWPRTVAADHTFSDRELRKLAGQSYSLSTSALLNGIMFLNPFGSWWQK